jgi:hypothetical protein
MRKLRRAAVLAGASLAMVAGTVAVTATPAMAAPSGCTVTVGLNAAGFNEATSLCTQGTGRYQVVVLLRGASLFSFPAPIYGPVVEVGQRSTVVYTGRTGFPVPVLAAFTQF